MKEGHTGSVICRQARKNSWRDLLEHLLFNRADDYK